MEEKIAIFWFRRDLRLVDNPAFFYALSSGYKVLPIFIFDTNILDKLEDRDDARLNFIHDRVTYLHKELRSAGGTIKVLHGDPEAEITQLINELPIAAIYANRDYEPYATERDAAVEAVCSSKGVDFLTFKDHVIFEDGEIQTDAGEPYKVFTPYSRKWKAKLGTLSLSSFDSQGNLHQLSKEYSYDMPSLGALGFLPSNIKIPSADFNVRIISDYEEKRNFPAVNGTSRLGIHLRHGTISIREAVKTAMGLSDTWLNELIWREFYITILAHFPHVVSKAFKPQYDQIPWRNDEEGFQKWCDGKTGYPIVDAGMRELVKTGFMHNRVRMITASFLTKHLLIDWRWGEAFFARHLLDFELSSNNGGWQWAAGTGTDAQPYFRVFNPASQTEKFDKQQAYIKKWVPEIGTPSYPEPMVDHKFARQRAIDTYKQALA